MEERESSSTGGLTSLIVLSESIRERAYELKETQDGDDYESVSVSGKRCVTLP